MKKFIAIMTTAALLLSALLAFVPTFAETKTASKGITVPKGYDPNCYLKLRAFLETKDKNGVKNGDKLWTGEFCDLEENVYDPDDPETWEVPEDDEYSGVFWYVDDNGIKKVSDVYLHCYYYDDDVLVPLVGELDLSGMENINQVSAWGIDGITALNTDGCDIKCLYFREGALRNIDWRCEEEDINIQLKSSGEGFVGVDYDNGIDEEDWDLENAHWCAYARPVQGKQFLGWYDTNGNCVGTELRYEFTVIPVPIGEPHWAPSPTGIHLNLEARFEGESAPTEEPPVTDEPEPPVTCEPKPPTVPKTGFISLAAIGVSAVIAGAGVVLFRKRK